MNDDALLIALLMYANEPCRVCGKLITHDDVRTAVFAGYSKNNESRSAHKGCWNMYPSLDGKSPRPEWKHTIKK